jgi:site-specific recombinase XerD
MMFTLYGTGLRAQELTGLKVDDVDFETGQIRLMGKGAKERRVYMSSRLFKVLLKYREKWRPRAESEWFFVTGQGRRITRYHLAHRMQQHGRKAGITGKRCSPKTLRSTFAVHYLRGGGDEFTLQKILGHTTLAMTRRYAELADSDVEDRLKAFSPAETLGIRL